MKKLLISCILVFCVVASSTQIAFSLETNPECTKEPTLKRQYHCHRYVRLNFGGSNGYYYVDYEQVQAVYWEGSTPSKFTMRNGEVMNFPNATPVVMYQYYINFLKLHTEFMK